MKSLVLTWVFMAMCVFALAQSSPAVKVQQARSASELSALSPHELAMLEFKAEKLCWFEDLKNDAPAEWYTLRDLSGNPVVLTDAMVADFNPLLYSLPQQMVKCENLPVQTSSGNQYLLIVRSSEQMEKEWKYRQVQINKSKNK